MTFPHTALVRRVTREGLKSSYEAHGSTPCFLQPLESEAAVAYGISFTKAWSCYVPIAADVTTGDKVTVNGVTYGVKGVREHNYGSLAHKRLALEEI